MNPRFPAWRAGALPTKPLPQILVEAKRLELSLPGCKPGVLPVGRRSQSWCPVRLGIPGPLVCRTSAHNPSELTGQILVGAEELESSTRRVRAGYVATNTSLPHGAGAANRTRVSSVPGTRSATELRRLEALIGFEPMTCSFGRSRAAPLRYRASMPITNPSYLPICLRRCPQTNFRDPRHPPPSRFSMQPDTGLKANPIVTLQPARRMRSTRLQSVLLIHRRLLSSTWGD